MKGEFADQIIDSSTVGKYHQRMQAPRKISIDIGLAICILHEPMRSLVLIGIRSCRHEIGNQPTSGRGG